MAANDDRTDIELIEAANQGDPGAFESLYRRYRDWVLKLAYRFTDDRDDALDVLQDTFTYFWRKFPGFELTAQLTTFLYPAVRHLALALKKKRRREPQLDETIDVAGPAMEMGDAGEEIASVVADLPKAQADVLLMRFVDGMQLQEIATALDVPLGTVKSRVHHAIRTLRKDPRVRAYFEQ